MSLKSLKNKVITMYQCGITKREICYNLKITFKKFDTWIETYQDNPEYMAVRNYFTGKSKDIICEEFNIDIARLNKLIDQLYRENPDNVILENNIQSGFSPWLSSLIYKSL